MSSAWSIVFTQARSAAYIGCSGSIAILTPQAWACGSMAAIPSVTICRAPGKSLEEAGNPPTTRTRQSALSAAASSMARRLSSICRWRPSAVSAGNIPPRQTPVTRILLAATIRAASFNPIAAI
jgi:hypothetical protein